MKTLTQTRFLTFKRKLYEQLGTVAVHSSQDGSVKVMGTSYRSLQAAIDSYSRYLPTEFVNPSPDWVHPSYAKL